MAYTDVDLSLAKDSWIIFWHTIKAVYVTYTVQLHVKKKKNK